MSSIVPPPIRHKICSKRSSPGLGNTTFCLRCAAFFITRRFCAAPVRKVNSISGLWRAVNRLPPPTEHPQQSRLNPLWQQVQTSQTLHFFLDGRESLSRGGDEQQTPELPDAWRQLLNRLRLAQDRNAGAGSLPIPVFEAQPPRRVRKPVAAQSQGVFVSRLPLRRPGVSTKDLLAGWRKILASGIYASASTEGRDGETRNLQL